MNDNREILEGRITELLALCARKGVAIATAESCTGGLLAACLTSIPGSSEMFDRGFVTYSNAAKTDLLGVHEPTIKQYGAVSGEVAAMMAEGALAEADANVAIAVTGIAGPDGGNDLKPVGLVWLGCAATWTPTFVHKAIFPDHGRIFIREAAVNASIEILLNTVSLAPDTDAAG